MNEAEFHSILVAAGRWGADHDTAEPERRKHFRVRHLQAAIATGLIEMAVPNKPHSRLQRYRLTALGRRRLATHLGV
jgi:hypothetical protein